MALNLERRQTAFNCRLFSFAIMNTDHIDPLVFFGDAKNIFLNEVPQHVMIHKMIKVNTCFSAEFVRSALDETVTEVFFFNTNNRIIDESTDLNLWYEEHVFNKLNVKLSEFLVGR